MNYDEIVGIIDRSGSMEHIKNDTIKGFNKFLEEQQAVDKAAKMTLVLFDSDYNMILDSVDIQEAMPLTKETYVTGSCTALLDAIGKTIDTLSKRIDEMQEVDRPDKVIVAILTDGYENDSREYTREQINDKIKFFDNGSWEFIFLAANQDAIQSGGGLGIGSSGCYNFNADSVGTQTAYRTMSADTVSYRNNAPVSDDINDNSDGVTGEIDD